MIRIRSIFVLGLIICLGTYSLCEPQRPNSKIEITRSTDLTDYYITPLNEVESPYSSDVRVNLNDSNIEDIIVEDIIRFSVLPISYNISTTSILNNMETTTKLPDSKTNLNDVESVIVSHGIYNLGKKIISQLLINNGNRDVKSEVISPLSIAGVGYLLYLGSAGQTEKELAKLLGLNNVTNQKAIHEQFARLLDDIIVDHEMNNEEKEYPEYIEERVHNISVANAIFLNNYFKLRQQYVNVVQNTYKSEVRPMDFKGRGIESKKYIDDWVSEKTHGKIPTILDSPPNGGTQMIVVSALYFKALWWEELGVLVTVKLPFYPNGEDNYPISVDTIVFASELLPYYESPELNCRIIGLRYQKQLSTMYIVQPLVSNRRALKEFQSNLTAETLDNLIQKMTYAHVSSFTFPKFHLESQTDLKLIFRQLGVRSLFTSANLSPITPSGYEKSVPNTQDDDLDYLDNVRRNSKFSSAMAISQIHHKVDLVVNERGTEGGAATAAVIDRIAARHIKVNTPFLFVIRQDNTRLPLFYGTVFEPEQD